MNNLRNSHNKTYSIGTSRFSYMMFAILTVIFFYIIAFFAPSVLTNIWTIIIICIIYCVLLFYVYIRGEKIIVTKDSIQLKGWFLRKKIMISEIKSYKSMDSSYTSGNKLITINTKNKKTTTINAIPNKDFNEFVNWLETEIEKEQELQLDPLTKQISPHESKYEPNVLNQKKTLKTYKVGKNFLNIFLVFSFIISVLTILIIVLRQNYSSSNNVFMYVQFIGTVLIIIGFIIYSMFIQNKILIYKDALIYKGLFLNRKLKFNEIKGFKIVHTAFFKRYQYIVIVPTLNTKKNITIRPTSTTSFIELADWIEKNLKKIE